MLSSTISLHYEKPNTDVWAVWYPNRIALSFTAAIYSVHIIIILFSWSHIFLETSRPSGICLYKTYIFCIPDI